MKLVKLSEVCLFNPPKNEARLALNSDQLVSFMPMQDLGIESIIAEASSSRTLGEVIKAYTYFAENDVLIAKITPCFENGKMGIARNLINGVGFGSSEYFVLRPMDSILSEYLYYFLRQEFVIENGREVMTGAVGHRRVPGEYLENLEIPLPPLEKQREIVEKLNDISVEFDLLENNLTSSDQEADQLLQSLLISAFVQSEINSESNEPLAVRRDGFKSVRLGDIVSFDKSQGSFNSAYVGLEDIESNTGIHLGSREPREVKSNTFCFTSEHVLYGRLRPYLNKVLLPNFDGHCSTEIFPIKVSGAISREYLFYWLRCSSTVEVIDKTSTGARMPRANMDAVLEFEIPLPSLEKQREIVEKLESAIADIDLFRTQIRKKKSFHLALRQSFLSSAFAAAGGVA